MTGVAGFLGSHVAHHFTSKGVTVKGIDNLTGGFVENVPNEVDFRAVDCLDRASYQDMIGTSTLIFHCAASAHDGFSIWAPESIYRDTVSSTVSLMTAAAHRQAKRVVFCSSMARYGDGKSPFSEDSPTRPVTPYAAAKVAAEQVVRTIGQLHGIEWNIAVPHSIYGPHQNRTDPLRNVAAIMMNRMLQGKQPIIYGDGSQVRCFSYVDDVVSCLAQMGTDRALSGQVINVGPDRHPVTILELAHEIAHALNLPLEPIYHPARPFEVHHAACSADKARNLLGYVETVELPEGISRMAEWMSSVGPSDFNYCREAEIEDTRFPAVWTNRLM